MEATALAQGAEAPTIAEAYANLATSWAGMAEQLLIEPAADNDQTAAGGETTL